ncbi:MAG: allophanate hydrolase subunit 1 [Candidatus Devosia euplotis]|nr:allophanate hydrolase subunit 1 [Candidatus Devosia euplotis]
MTGSFVTDILPIPTIVPLGDAALLVRLGAHLTDPANRAAIALAALLERAPLDGVVEVVPSLVSVLLRCDPLATGDIAGELHLLLFSLDISMAVPTRDWTIPVRFDGLDLEEVASALGPTTAAFIATHNARKLRVLATSVASGFVYCGLHADELVLPRRAEVRSTVPLGTVLFAAGQTDITATEPPTGWHVVSRADVSNFDPNAELPTKFAAGDYLNFTVAS